MQSNALRHVVQRRADNGYTVTEHGALTSSEVKKTAPSQSTVFDRNCVGSANRLSTS